MLRLAFCFRPVRSIHFERRTGARGLCNNSVKACSRAVALAITLEVEFLPNYPRFLRSPNFRSTDLRTTAICPNYRWKSFSSSSPSPCPLLPISTTAPDWPSSFRSASFTPPSLDQARGSCLRTSISQDRSRSADFSSRSNWFPNSKDGSDSGAVARFWGGK